MLNSEIVKKIEEFVYSRPRSIQEIAKHIEKNWRTADRYVGEIEKEYGTISTKTFRGGTRGALKIAFWASIEKASSSIFQEQLENTILNNSNRDFFSAFDIFQHIDKNKKEIELFKVESEEDVNLDKLSCLINKAKNNVLVFSGNLSFVNFKDDNIDIIRDFENLVEKGIKLKVIGRVDISSKNSVKRLLDLNFKYGKDLVEIRHREQPVRAMIIDKDFFRIKEVKRPTGRANELDNNIFIFYTIKDKEWTEWLTKIFWKMFSSSIDANKRLEELNKLRI